ncbi:hypothetical protein CEXT_430561, partial [Caerostris extrusa]
VNNASKTKGPIWVSLEKKKVQACKNIRAHRRDEQIQEDNADVRVSMAHFRGITIARGTR